MRKRVSGVLVFAFLLAAALGAQPGTGPITGGGGGLPGPNEVTEAMLKAVNSPTDEFYLSYEATVGDFEWQAVTSGVGGSTGGTDDALLCADGTGGATLGVCTVGLLDNLSLDGNTVATTTGNLILNPSGTSDISLFGETSTDLRIRLTTAPTPDGSSPAFRLITGNAGAGAALLANSLFTPNETFPTLGVHQGQFIMASGGFVSWYSSSSDFSGARDLLLRRQAAGVMRVDNGSGGVGSALSGVLVEAHTTGDTLDSVESGSVHTNAAAGGSVTLNLPGAAANLRYRFIVMAAQDLVIDAAAGDVIYVGTTASTSGGTATASTIGAQLDCVAVDATNWMCADTGTWTPSS